MPSTSREPMSYPPPEADRIMVLAPHPDDESIGCGGTIALYSRQGTEVHLVVVTKGEKAEIPLDNLAEVRRAEALAAARILGISQVTFLDFPDESVATFRDGAKERIAAIVREAKPRILFAPYPLDPHSDHRAVSSIAVDLLTDFPGLRVAFYEVYNPIRFDVLVEITEVREVKRRAMLSYQTSMLGMPEVFLKAIEGLNDFRGLFLKSAGSFESFWIVETPLSNDDIIRWTSFDFAAESPQSLFLSKLRVADKLIAELQTSYAALEERNGTIRHLTGAMQDKDAEALALREAIRQRDERIRALERAEEGSKERIASLERTEAELKERVQLIETSVFFPVLHAFYRLRDRFLPEGTARRRTYRRIVEMLKR